MLAINEHGQMLKAFLNVTETQLDAFSPLTHALVVLQQAENVLVVFDQHKQKWQLPGGLIEPGENARMAAARELLEETNQQADLHFVGVLHWDLQGTQVLHQTGEVYGALFHACLEDLAPFLENPEIVAWHFLTWPDEKTMLDPLIRGILQAFFQRDPASK